MPNEPVLHQGRIYSAETSDDDKAVIRAYGQDEKLIWELEGDGRGDLILAGNQLVAVGGGLLTLIDLPTADQSPRIASRMEVNDGIERLLAADEKLFAVTLDGRILAFGEASSQSGETTRSRAGVDEPPNPADQSLPDSGPLSEADHTIKAILSSGVAEGYGLWFGKSDSPLATAMTNRSPFEQLRAGRSGLPSRQPNPPTTRSARLVWIDHRARQ